MGVSEQLLYFINHHQLMDIPPRALMGTRSRYSCAPVQSVFSFVTQGCSRLSGALPAERFNASTSAAPRVRSSQNSDPGGKPTLYLWTAPSLSQKSPNTPNFTVGDRSFRYTGVLHELTTGPCWVTRLSHRPSCWPQSSTGQSKATDSAPRPEASAVQHTRKEHETAQTSRHPLHSRHPTVPHQSCHSKNLHHSRQQATTRHPTQRPHCLCLETSPP